jgi:hypothetical protein
MRVFSVQHKAVGEALRSRHVVVGRPNFDDPAGASGFQDAYMWLVQQMAMHLGPMTQWNGGTIVGWPMWSWVPTPLMEVETLLAICDISDDEEVLELEIPDDQLVCHDYDLWHSVLNDSPLCLFENEQVNKEESWERVFAVDPVSGLLTLNSPDPLWLDLESPSTIQATSWCFKPEWLVT